MSAEWATSLVEMLDANAPKDIPRGWFTVWMYADKEQLSYSAAFKWCHIRWRRNLLERKPHPNPAGNGSPCFIYRVAKKK